MGVSEDAVLELVGMAYDAALDERKWPIFLAAFANAVGGSSSLLRSVDLQTNKADFVANVGYDPAWQSAYCNYFVKMDFLTRTLDQFKVGEVKCDQTLILFDQRKTELYNDYLLPQDKPHTMGVFLSKDGSRTLLFSVQRNKRAGVFGEEERRLIGILTPHVTRAMQVYRKIGTLAAEKEYALTALDELRLGVILTNRCGVPLFLNCAAAQMLAPGHGINTHQGRLVLSGASETAKLYQLIANAAQGVSGTVMGGDMRIALPNGEFLHCQVMPITPEISARWDISQASGCVALFLSKPSGLQLPPKRLAALYGLTPAEARLAAKLAALSSVEQAADELCIAVSTARTQLRSVFVKTGAQSQSELLMLLATGTLAQCRDE